MTDREKVIRGLECCLLPNDHENCPYDGIGKTYSDCLKRLATDALALLKEQEELLKDAHALLKEQIENGLHEWNKGYRAGCEAMKKLL